MLPPALSTHAKPLAQQLESFIGQLTFPCVGAKSALQKNQIKVIAARSITSGWNDLSLHSAIVEFGDEYARNRKMFQSLAVVFEAPLMLDEASFERAMWSRLRSLSAKDKWKGNEYDENVSNDPSNPHFSLSFGGHAFFVVGLHPRASRKARRFARPTMIFNLHDQFERLRAEGRYEKLRSSILERDIAFSGSLNPMLARHGETSEARQYSGRNVPANWECPFNHAA